MTVFWAAIRRVVPYGKVRPGHGHQGSLGLDTCPLEVPGSNPSLGPFAAQSVSVQTTHSVSCAVCRVSTFLSLHQDLLLLYPGKWPKWCTRMCSCIQYFKFTTISIKSTTFWMYLTKGHNWSKKRTKAHWILSQILLVWSLRWPHSRYILLSCCIKIYNVRCEDKCASSLCIIEGPHTA